jgi:hypothetical protein
MTPEDGQPITDREMEQELEEIITEAMKRPLTADEAHCVAFHCGVRFTKPWSHHA